MGQHWSANGTREIITVKRSIVMQKFRPGPKILEGVVVADVAVKLVGAIPAGHDGLDGTGATVLHAEGVWLNGDFLNRIRIRSQVQHARPNVAGDVHSIHHVHVSNTAASVRAGIDLRLSRIVISRRARTPANQTQADDTRSHNRER